VDAGLFRFFLVEHALVRRARLEGEAVCFYAAGSGLAIARGPQNRLSVAGSLARRMAVYRSLCADPAWSGETM
jgi:hypothetical protein